MGGMRAAGDLVARMQMTRSMRLKEAKEHVAAKLGVTPFDLSDPAVMTDVRNELGFGRIHSYAISQPTQANAVFAVLDNEAADRIRERVRFYDWDRAGGEVRWMTAFDTTEADIDNFVTVITEELAR